MPPEAIQRLKAVEHDGEASRANARQMLDALQGLSHDPGTWAAQLEAMAAASSGEIAAGAQDAASALRATGRLLAA